MSRYVTRAVWAYDLDDEVHMHEALVTEQERGPVKTGLLDASGQPLYRMPDALPIGFDLRPRVRVKAVTRKF
jgi:hypothetical protein